MLPASGVGYRALVEYAAEQVDEDGDREDDQEDGARPHAPRLVRLHARARVLRLHLEHVRALLRIRRDEGDLGRSGAGVPVAAEEYRGGLSSSRLVRLLRRLRGHGSRGGRRIGLTFVVGISIRGAIVNRASLPLRISLPLAQPRPFPLRALAAGRSSGILQHELLAARYQGARLQTQAIHIALRGVVSADVLPLAGVDTDDAVDGLDHGATDVQREIGPVVEPLGLVVYRRRPVAMRRLRPVRVQLQRSVRSQVEEGPRG